jgi:hypothetical protein
MERVARGIVGRYRALNPVRVRARKRLAMSYYREKLNRIAVWAPQHTENDNFYYALTPRNRRDLSALIAVVVGSKPGTIDGYLAELFQDQGLRSHITSIMKDDPELRDIQVEFGRREGWYAIVRALKPTLVVETGVHHGVGACVLTAALLANAAEGFSGRYLGTDINPDAGRLFVGRYAEQGRILYGDSIASLTAIDDPIDVFINDSDHSAEYEGREYDAIASKLAQVSVVLGDNSHVTQKLSDFAREHDRPFVFFKEEPDQHWYPGAGIGISPSSVPIGSIRQV